MCSRLSIGFLDFEVVVFKKSYLLLPTISDIYKFKPTIYIKFTAEMLHTVGDSSDPSPLVFDWQLMLETIYIYIDKDSTNYSCKSMS